MSNLETESVVRPELLQIAEAVARDRSIEKDLVIEAMEQAIVTAARRKYGQDLNIKVEIDRKSGEIKLSRVLEIVESVENSAQQITQEEGKIRDPNAKLGDYFFDPLPPIDLGRVAAQTAKQVIVQRVKEAEKERQFEEYKDRAGEIINGLVKRVEYGNVIVDLGRAEAFMRRDDTIPRESFRSGDRIRAYITEVRKDSKGPQIFISRACNEFMDALFTQEVPEIYDGIIEIRSVSRDPGSRAKIAVISQDKTIDPVGACVGMRGSRVQAVVNELQGEKIDIIPWSEDSAAFIVNSLSPAEVTKVVLDEENKKVEVVVPDDQLSLAIGRRGQNVRLASQLSSWDIAILTEGSESERRLEEFKNDSNDLIEALVIDEVIAHLLVSEGFRSVEAVAYVPLKELVDIEGFDEKLAEELRNRALTHISDKNKILDKERQELGVSDEIASIEGLEPSMLVVLGKAGIKSRDNLADLSSDELKEILGDEAIQDETVAKIIMIAREPWFKNEDKIK